MTQKVFCRIWDDLIIPEYKKMNKAHGGLYCPEYEKEAIKVHYESVVRHAKEQYMRDSTGVLNRHKVAAALMIAILKTKPIKKVDITYYLPNKEGKATCWPFNEILAVTVALSVLRAFILTRADFAFSGAKISKRVFGDVVLEDKEIFKQGIPIGENERKEWEWELYQIRQHGAYNLLSLAHTLRELEKRCRMEYFLENKNLSPTYPDPNNLVDESVDITELENSFNIVNKNDESRNPAE